MSACRYGGLPGLSIHLHPWPMCRSEEHTSELQSQSNLVCRLLLEKKIRRPKSEDATCARFEHGHRRGLAVGVEELVHAQPPPQQSIHYLTSILTPAGSLRHFSAST